MFCCKFSKSTLYHFYFYDICALIGYLRTKIKFRLHNPVEHEEQISLPFSFVFGNMILN